MPDPWVPDPAPLAGTDAAIALSPQTYARHARAVDYMERGNRARYPRPSRGRTTSTSAGAWAKLASGDTISAASGLTLGSGSVTLCSRSGASLTADGKVITVYNAGETIVATGADKIVKLSWVDVWVASRCN